MKLDFYLKFKINVNFMDKTIEQIFKAFNHIAREIQVYFISGTLILLNIFIIDFFYYKSSIWLHIHNKPFIVPCIVVSYVFGHISMALYYVLLEWTEFDKKMQKRLGLTYAGDEKKLPKFFKDDRETYTHFIERNHILTNMRCTMSSGLFINFLINSTYLLNNYKWQVCLLLTLSFVSSILIFILSMKSDNEYFKSIDNFKELLNEKQKP
jgi:hypothetical protein